jgi:hypothetical protein
MHYSSGEGHEEEALLQRRQTRAANAPNRLRWNPDALLTVRGQTRTAAEHLQREGDHNRSALMLAHARHFGGPGLPLRWNPAVMLPTNHTAHDEVELRVKTEHEEFGEEPTEALRTWHEHEIMREFPQSFVQRSAESYTPLRPYLDGFMPYIAHWLAIFGRGTTLLGKLKRGLLADEAAPGVIFSSPSFDERARALARVFAAALAALKRTPLRSPAVSALPQQPLADGAKLRALRPLSPLAAQWNSTPIYDKQRAAFAQLLEEFERKAKDKVEVVNALRSIRTLLSEFTPLREAVARVFESKNFPRELVDQLQRQRLRHLAREDEVVIGQHEGAPAADGDHLLQAHRLKIERALAKRQDELLQERRSETVARELTQARQLKALLLQAGQSTEATQAAWDAFAEEQRRVEARGGDPTNLDDVLRALGVRSTEADRAAVVEAEKRAAADTNLAPQFLHALAGLIP